MVLALDRVSLDVAPGEFVCLLGASGCGKSTLLNLVAGLDQPTSGDVDVRANRTALMFQEAALFPWLTVRGNVELALKLGGYAARTPTRRAASSCSRWCTSPTSPRSARTSSRAACGSAPRWRASLAQDAEVLLMDEPFGALDAMTRDVLHDELETLWRTTDKTVLFVTHNVREAIRLGDRVVLLSSRPGRVAEITPVHIDRPRRIDSTEVATLAATITDRLREEMERHARGN